MIIRPRRRLAMFSLCVLLASCGGVSPKVTIDRADHAALASVRAFQLSEEAAWHASAVWPTAVQHADINGKVSQAYQLIVAVANLGISLPPGATLTAADLAAVAQLAQVVADLVALTQRATPAVQQQAAAAQQRVAALRAAVLGGVR